MNLEQITIDFVPEHDRLLLRLAGGEKSEILLWLTRRCIKLLWPRLTQMAESVPVIAQQAAPAARQALLGMERERALAKADFSKPYAASGRERPLGAEPLVVARINTGRNDTGQHVLALAPREGAGVNLAMDDTLFHGLCKLLQDAVAKAEWDMALELPLGPVAGSVEGVPKTIN